MRIQKYPDTYRRGLSLMAIPVKLLSGTVPYFFVVKQRARCVDQFSCRMKILVKPIGHSKTLFEKTHFSQELTFLFYVKGCKRGLCEWVIDGNAMDNKKRKRWETHAQCHNSTIEGLILKL